MNRQRGHVKKSWCPFMTNLYTNNQNGFSPEKPTWTVLNVRFQVLNSFQDVIMRKKIILIVLTEINSIRMQKRT